MTVNHEGEQLGFAETLPVMGVDPGLALVEQLIREKLASQSTVLVAVVGGSATGKNKLYISTPCRKIR